MRRENKIISSDEIYTAKHSWLKSHYLFSFADYYNGNNINFGNLRVFNDDYIKAHSGFGMHPHNNMEILTIPLQGAVSHVDTLGNQGKITAGDIQIMSAGSGITHSEENKEDDLLHLYQLWFTPHTLGGEPSYQDHNLKLKKNTLNLLASGEKEDNVGFLNADVQVYRGTFERDEALEYQVREHRGLFIYIYKGDLTINGIDLEAGDQVRYSKYGTYNIRSNSDELDFILIDVAMN